MVLLGFNPSIRFGDTETRGSCQLATSAPSSFDLTIRREDAEA
jgi:hypothetical protein